MEQSTQFLAAAKRWSFLDGTPFVAAHVANVAELEHFVLAGSADSYAAVLEKRWQELEPDFVSTDHPLKFGEESVMPPLSRVGCAALSRDQSLA